MAKLFIERPRVFAATPTTIAKLNQIRNASITTRASANFGAETTELEHQRRMVSLRADGVIAILCPGASETLAGVAVMTVPPEEAREVMDGDPCVQADMIRCEVFQVHGFPGDALPA